ncbi:MAG: TolC family outer membrane protein [Oceanospirillaceae bacterium]
MNIFCAPFMSLLSLTLFSSASQATSLEQIYQLARQSDPQLLTAAANFQGSKENIVQVKAALKPSVDGQLNSRLNHNTNNSTSDTQGYSIHLTQPIYSPALSAAVKKVNIADTIAKLAYQQSEQNLILRTVDAYINTMVAKSNLSTIKAQERAIKRTLDQAQAEFDVGLSAITDVYEARASYDNAKVDRIISEGQLENSYQSLQRLSGKNIVAVDTLDNKYTVTTLSPNQASYWVEQVSSGNLALEMAQLNIASTIKDSEIAKSNRGVSVELQAIHSGSEDSKNGWTQDSQIGLVLSIPLYSGGSLNSKVRQSLSSEEAVKQIYQDTLREVTQTTRSLVRDIETNVLAVKARQQSILSSRAALNAVNEGFKAGTRNVVDILQAENSLFDARNSYATVRLEQIRLKFKLKFQAGSLNEQDISDISQWMLAEKSGD